MGRSVVQESRQRLEAAGFERRAIGAREMWEHKASGASVLLPPDYGRHPSGGQVPAKVRSAIRRAQQSATSTDQNGGQNGGHAHPTNGSSPTTATTDTIMNHHSPTHDRLTMEEVKNQELKDLLVADIKESMTLSRRGMPLRDPMEIRRRVRSVKDLYLLVGTALGVESLTGLHNTRVGEYIGICNMLDAGYQMRDSDTIMTLTLKARKWRNTGCPSFPATPPKPAQSPAPQPAPAPAPAPASTPVLSSSPTGDDPVVTELQARHSRLRESATQLRRQITELEEKHAKLVREADRVGNALLALTARDPS